MGKGRAFPRHLSPGIRLQLTLWYTTIFALLLLLSGGILYLNLNSSLTNGLDTALQLRAQQIAGDVHFEGNKIILVDTASELPGFDTRDNHPTSLADVSFDTLVRLLDPQGHILDVSPAFLALRVPVVSITQPLHGSPWQGTVIATNGQPVRVYSRTVSDDGHVFAVVQVGESLSLVENSLAHIATALLVAALVMLLCGALGSYWLAGRAFAPIRRLIEVTRVIKAGDLHQRVPVPQTTDEIHALAVTLNDMLASLEQTLNLQRRFVSDASHELRTPVAVIRSKADLALQQSCQTEEYIRILSDINQESERLGHLIGDLLALARGDENRTRFDWEVVPLHLLAEAVVGSAELLAAERGVTLHMETETPVMVYGDEARLIQVILNLLNNAILYTNTGGCVTLSVTTTASHARLTIRDTGIGIAAEHLTHIFERFYRVDPARVHRESNNSGLGLAIVDWLVRAHRGSITVESEVGQGSVFTVTLPLYQQSTPPLQKRQK